ncbi:hypothetical protein [Oceanobacillus jeddahense]|uniref:hypothetical protein n=1 Tax=Oceanobacillus jeddahense TaxID=1462527 RepID=UPI000596196C|nr:hypothetical protein [Oceanobacillus jeddahense]
MSEKIKTILRKKWLPAIITTINCAFVFMLYAYSTESADTNLLEYLKNIMLFAFLIIIVYVGPVVFIIGITVSIFIDKIVCKLKNSKVKETVRFLLYLFSGFAVIWFISFITGSGFSPVMTNNYDIGAFILISFYPSTVFWGIDRLKN